MLLLTSGCKPNFDIGSKELLCSVYLYIYSRFGLRVFSATFVNSGLFCVDMYFRLTLMQSSVVAASAGCIRNAVALRDPCALTLSSGAPDALELLGLLMKEKFQRLRLETKSLKLSQNSATLGTCSLQEVAASWLRSRAANVHGASSANCFPFSPTAICPF